MNRKIVFYILAAIILIFSLFVGGSFPFLLFFLIILVTIYSRFSNYYTIKNLAGVFWCNKYQFVRGDTISIEYKIYNGGILPVPYADVRDDLDNRLTSTTGGSQLFFIKPYDYVRIKKEFLCMHRGKYDIGKLSVNVEDIFTLKESKATIEDPLNIVVYPKVYKIKKINLFGKEFFGTSKTNEKHNEDYSNIKNLREYTRGDSLRRIHWKTTARKGELFVKNYNTSANLNVKVFMDFQIDKYKNLDEITEDRIVELTVSIIYFTLYNNIETELITYSDKRLNIKRTNISFLNNFLDAMVMIRPKSNRKISDVILDEINLSSIGTTIVIVTVDLDKDLTHAIYSIRKMGLNVTLFIIKDSYNKQTEEDIISLEKLLVKVYKLYDNDEIEKVLG
ncbi:DUF58 domain-containing protein [Clostridium sp. D2Q-11]|uniref:DUF58 domain-containing protein n=1 Tax=Anaeromonas frigoriresistens TaxID=2683708 RepID=A0A942UY73_9FIRM|nr:DUF58 domain-containing protein [Anaeromonas frigoriresistens]MBS4537792.1 DUF58 domain-containing protein [Anaeromonas frigoriresistens]